MTKIIGVTFLLFGIIGTIVICFIDAEHSSYISIGSWTVLGIRMLADSGNSD